MTTTQFEPIADPLSLSPSDFVSRARERGLTLARIAGFFDRAKQSGCYFGVAAAMASPTYRDSKGEIIHELLGFPCNGMEWGAAHGFDGERPMYFGDAGDKYSRWYAKGRDVARAAGLEEGEPTS